MSAVINSTRRRFVVVCVVLISVTTCGFYGNWTATLASALHSLHDLSSIQNGALQDSPILNDKSINSSCATKNHPSLIIVVARGKREDISWLRQGKNLASNVYIYQGEDNVENDLQEMGFSFVTLPGLGKFREAGYYIHSILEHYHNPSWTHMAFFHPHQRAWHSLLTNDWIMRRWSSGWTPSVDVQYAGIHCRQASRMDTRDVTTRQILKGNGAVHADPDPLLTNHSKSIVVQAWDELFVRWLGEMPIAVQGPCCAEFIVSRQAVHSRPIQFYEAVLEWFNNTSLRAYKTGYAMEFVWHYIFTGKDIFLLPQRECLCQLYGLQHLPPQFVVPPDIAANIALITLILSMVCVYTLKLYTFYFQEWAFRGKER